MKKVIFICAILLVAGYGAYRGVLVGHIQHDGHQLTIGEHTLTVELARTVDEQAHGLMYRTELADSAGMLFIFSNSSSKTFWNKNTYIPLDVIWIRDHYIVGISELPAIYDGLTTVASPGTVTEVLEVNHGWSARHDVHIGTRVW